MAFEADIMRYCPQGYVKEPFFAGELISVPSNCSLYLHPNRQKKEASIILGSILASEAADIVKACRGLETMLRGYEVAKQCKQERYIHLLAVDDVLQRPWSDGAKAVIPKLKETLDSNHFSSGRRKYRELVTGYGSSVPDEKHDLFCLALILVQSGRFFDDMLDLYLTLVEGCARKSLQSKEEMPILANYEFGLNALRKAIIEKHRPLQLIEERTIRGYSERLHLAGIASLAEFKRE